VCILLGIALHIRRLQYRLFHVSHRNAPSSACVT
jgi:hypothetical protein